MQVKLDDQAVSLEDDWDELCGVAERKVECSLLAGSEGRDHYNPECRIILAVVSNVSSQWLREDWFRVEFMLGGNLPPSVPPYLQTKNDYASMLVDVK